MSTFEIGDRVVLARPDELDRLNGLKAGMVGTVREEVSLWLHPTHLVAFDDYSNGVGDARDERNIAVEQLEPADEPVPAEAGPEPVPAEAGPEPVPAEAGPEPASLIGRRIRITHGHALAPTSAEGVITTPVVTILADVTPGADTDEDGDYWVTLDHPVIPGGETMCVGTRDRFELID